MRQELELSALYADIIDLPHPVSRRHRPMPLEERAAQFAPFAALTGYGDLIDEATEEHNISGAK